MKEKRSQTRREFVKTGATALIGTPVFLSSFSTKGITITGRDIEKHFQQVGTWMNWEQTTDTFKFGNPEKEIKKVAIAWKINMDSIKKAMEMEADLFISHESICVNTPNSEMVPEIKFAMPSELPKFDLMKEADLLVYRCHDLWDSFPEIGIRDTWRKKLKLGDKIIGDKYPYYVTETKPRTVEELAKHILEIIQPLREKGVMISGNRNKTVSKVGTGTGVCSDPFALRDLGADVGIMTDDYYRHVRQGIHADELDFPTIIVNHAVAEEWGIMNLSKYIQEQFPTLEVNHIPQYCPYQYLTL
jgi:putative NIF3 family GTP cyclohydrolase 1 type 2